MDDHANVRTAIDQLVEQVEETRDVDETLTLLTAMAVDSVPGVDFASVSLRRQAEPIETLAPTDPLAVAMDEFQYEFREGPCFEVATSEVVVLANDLASDQRWPTYGPQAVAVGVHSQLALVLLADRKQRAALNLYSRQRQNFDGSLEIAELFAAQAALVMGFARTIKQLDQAMGARTVIGQAVGIVMERNGLDQAQAFHLLNRLSQESNTKLRVVAENLVNEVASRHDR